MTRFIRPSDNPLCFTNALISVTFHLCIFQCNHILIQSNQKSSYNDHSFNTFKNNSSHQQTLEITP